MLTEIKRILYIPLFWLFVLSALGPNVIAQIPDYSDLNNWAAHPMKADDADKVPGNGENDLTNIQSEAEVDVFFLHPTTYTGAKKNCQWNAPIGNEKINEKTDRSTIRYQASIFNGAGKVYAPRYRQAHLKVYYTKKRQVAKQALQVAYEDVRNAFEYYLEHFNEGRPIIIAGHSQGTQHAVQLIQEFFDGKPLKGQLVIAYLVGMPVSKSSFDQIIPCENESQLGCFCSWRTYQKGYFPKFHMAENDLAATNPLTWNSSEVYADQSQNKGAVLKNFKKVLTNLADAQIKNGLLWTRKPKFPGSFLIRTKNYHIADYNLFWINVRENARLRSDKYLELLVKH